jgi:TRAP-type mannitol/chloroaromatic compound transport system permease large subunit
MTAAFISFVALFALLFFGIPLAFSLGLVGLVAFSLAIGAHAASAMAAQVAWDTLTSYSLSVLPLFILMGNFVNQSGLSRQLYDASNAFVGHRRAAAPRG